MSYNNYIKSGSHTW